jgi:predicted alpha-1,2-mannosidase
MRKNAMQPGDPSGKYGRVGIQDFIELGYVAADRTEHSASRTMDFSYNDFCVSQVAKVLGNTDDHELFRNRALNYHNTFDKSKGFMRGRNSDGSWLQPFDEFDWGGAFIEGSVWQCGWAVPHDIKGLIGLMGGRNNFIEKLDKMMRLPPHFNVGNYPLEIHEMTEMASVDFGQYAHSNQPVHHVLYLFTSAGIPHKTQYWVRRVLNELYGPGPDGFAGDEDNGEMSCWYIFSALGFYPLCPGYPAYVFGSPLFKFAKLTLPDGKAMRIEAPDNSRENLYVHGIRLNGRGHRQTFISHKDLTEGGRLLFQMKKEPRSDAEYEDDTLPYSLSKDG